MFCIRARCSGEAGQIGNSGWKRLCLETVSIVALLAAGCGDDSGVGRTLPVRGLITLNDEPLTAESTTVLFKPDAGLGNTSRFEPAGTVDADGYYTLLTKGKSGAPPGWYRVIVTALAEDPIHPKGPRRHRPVAQSLLPAKYGQRKTTDLTIEVVENPAPGAYDLKLKK
jgi:hypothetical protein